MTSPDPPPIDGANPYESPETSGHQVCAFCRHRGSEDNPLIASRDELTAICSDCAQLCVEVSEGRARPNAAAAFAGGLLLTAIGWLTPIFDEGDVPWFGSLGCTTVGGVVMGYAVCLLYRLRRLQRLRTEPPAP
ncbi:MAG: ClpX C4-type zinc finger protein [Planctomycetota bacterium]